MGTGHFHGRIPAIYRPLVHENRPKKKGSDKIVGFFSADKGELAPEERRELSLEQRVELLERDESDLDAIRDIQKTLEQHREDILQDILLERADEGKIQ